MTVTKKPRQRGASNRTTLDRFPLDVNFLNSDSFRIAVDRGNIGLEADGILIRLISKIHREHGYYCEWNDDIASVFVKYELRARTTVSELSKIIEAFIEVGIFDKNYYQDGILTGRDIQVSWGGIQAECKRAKTKPDNYSLL